MIQDIKPQFLNNQYHNCTLQDMSSVVIFNGREILVKRKNDEVEFLHYGEFAKLCEQAGAVRPECIYLFSIGEKSYFMPDIAFVAENNVLEMFNDAAEGFEFIKMYDLRRMKPKETVFAGATAWHLYNWYRSNRYCGVCSGVMKHDEKERMMHCPNCGNMVFPKLVPAVIVGVKNHDRLLMTKYAGREYKRYALIAGFTEIGETVEETVAREVMEEAGVKVKNITYYKSQPWGFDSDLLLGFFCDLDGDDTIHMDDGELSVAEWIDYKDMPRYHEGLSLTEEMMNHFIEERINFHRKDK
ncbi:MAG: NAD(+) diphosphatase [Lachnospiraceae bacterium]